MTPNDAVLPNGPASVVRVRDLNHCYGSGEGRKQVLFDVNFDLLPGEMVIMTGPSGSGKTTLLTLIGALRSPQSGSLRVLGRELAGLSAAGLVTVRREMGFIFQAHNLFTALTALQNVRMALELKHPAGRHLDEQAADMLKQLGLGARLGHRPAALSGGQQQRVAIARALVNRPKLLLADEPTAALDKESGHQVIELFRQLTREQGCGILLVTHDNRILEAADRIVNMVDGRVVSDMGVNESVEVCEFLSHCPVFAGHGATGLVEIARKMKREQHPAGTNVISIGEPGDKFYLLRRGTVDVLNRAGERFDDMTEGDFFGEAALLTGAPRNATIRASSPIELYALSKVDFLAAVEAMKSFKDQVLQALFVRRG